MQVIGGKNRPEPLLEPGVDFLQERGIDQAAGERVIDTQYDFVPGVATRLNGRKYVGENTVREMGRLIGLVDADEAQRITEEFNAYKAQVAEAFAQMRELTDRVDHFLSNQPQVPTGFTPPPDADAIAATTEARHKAEVDQIAASEAARNPQEEDVATRNLTGSERAAIERHTGPLREVDSTGQNVDVPEEFIKAVDGVEEISDSDTAKQVYNRGLGAGEEQAERQQAAAEKTDAAQNKTEGGASYAGSGGTDAPEPAAETSKGPEGK